MHEAEDEAEELVGGHEVGVKLEDAATLLGGVVVVAQEKERPGEGGLDAGGDGIEFCGVLHGDKAILAAAHAEECVGIVLVGDSVVGVDGDGGFELSIGSLPVPVVVGIDGEQGGVGFGEGVVEGEGFEGGGLGAGIGLGRWSELVEALELVATSEGCVGARVVGVDGDGVVKEGDGLEEGGLGALAYEEFSLHVVAVGLGVDDAGWGGWGCRGVGELGNEGGGDSLGDGGLGGGDVGVVGGEGLRPEIGAAAGFDETHGDGEGVGGAMEVACYDGLDFKFWAG